MNAIPYEGREEDWDRYEGDVDDEVPRRPRRQFFNRWSALLFAVLLGGIGFYVGIRVEKGQLASSPSPLAGAFASRFGGAAGAAGAAGATGATGATGTSRAGGGSSAASRFGAGAGAGGGGFAALFGGGGGGGNAIGTVASVNGNTLYVTETSGNTVKVKLSGATKLTKDQPVGKSKVYPGDTVVVGGVTGSGGTITATSLTDSGTRSTGSANSTSSSGSSSSSSSGNSAVSSLFGGG